MGERLAVLEMKPGLMQGAEPRLRASRCSSRGWTAPLAKAL